MASFSTAVSDDTDPSAPSPNPRTFPTHRAAETALSTEQNEPEFVPNDLFAANASSGPPPDDVINLAADSSTVSNAVPASSPNPRPLKKHREEDDDPSMDENKLNSVTNDLFGVNASSRPLPSDVVIDLVDDAPKDTFHVNGPAISDEVHALTLDTSLSNAKQSTRNTRSSTTLTTKQKLDLLAESIFRTTIDPPTTQWTTDLHPSLSGLTAYQLGELSGDSNGFSRNNCLKTHVLFGIKLMTLNGGLASVHDWSNAFAQAFKSIPANVPDRLDTCGETRRLAIRLALTDPIAFFPSSYFTKKKELRRNMNVANAWTASYLRYGAPWRNRNHWFTSHTPKSTDLMIQAKHSLFPDLLKDPNRHLLGFPPDVPLIPPSEPTHPDPSSTIPGRHSAPASTDKRSRSPEAMPKNLFDLLTISPTAHSPASASLPRPQSIDDPLLPLPGKHSALVSTDKRGPTPEATPNSSLPVASPKLPAISPLGMPNESPTSRTSGPSFNLPPKSLGPKKVGFLSSSTPSPSPLSSADNPDGPRPPATTAHGMFLNKPLRPSAPIPSNAIASKPPMGISCKFRSYIKVKLPELSAEFQRDQAAEAIHYFRGILDHLWQLDPKMAPLSWLHPSDETPLRRNNFPSTRARMSIYLDTLWLSQGRAPFCRMLLAHDRPRDSLFSDDRFRHWLREHYITLTVERIQSKDTKLAGHLLGYRADIANVEDLADAIEAQPSMAGISIEIRNEAIKGSKFGSKTDRILQIYVSHSQAASARHNLIQLYSSAAKGRYPQGVQARFIPGIDDLRFIRNRSAVKMYEKSLRKHSAFMRNTDTYKHEDILQLDHVIGDVSLRQAIMHIRSTTNNWNLFVSVESRPDSHLVDFAFRKELQREALEMISSLPLFLQHHLGTPRVWDWFTVEAKAAATNYYWDPDKNTAVPLVTDDPVTDWEALDDEDDELSIADDDSDILHSFTLDLHQLGQNAYSDGNSIQTAAYRDPPPSPLAHAQPSLPHDDPFPPDDVTMRDSTAATSTSTSTLTTTPDRLSLLQGLSDDPNKNELFEKMLDDPATREALLLALQTKTLSIRADVSSGVGDNGS
jgi:hypothetical protein